MRACISASDSPFGEPRTRRRALHRLPEVRLGEVGELAAGPLAVVGLDHTGQRAHLEPVVRRHGRRGLRRALDRARVDRRDRQPREARRRAPRPARGPASERSIPGARPESNGPVCAVTAWRASTSLVAGGAFGVSGVPASAASVASAAASGLVDSVERRGSNRLRHTRDRTGAAYIHAIVTDRPINLSTRASRDGARRRAAGGARRPARRARVPGARAAGRRRRRRRPLAPLPRRLGATRRPRRDDVEAYACFRVGYHRGLDRLRQSGWRGSGYVRWRHETNRGFLRALDGLRRSAAAIGEVDEERRCDEFLHQLDPDWDRARRVGRSPAAAVAAMKRALITGITGQDGRFLAQFLAEQGLPGLRAHPGPEQPEGRDGARRRRRRSSSSTATCATCRR